MIADGDSAARNAFRVGLLAAFESGETLLPVNTTEELDPSDILEVRDMAEAIARAEQIVAAPRSSRPSSRRFADASSRRNVSGDPFELMGHRATDDTAGPATPAPIATAEQLMRPESLTRPIRLDARANAVAGAVTDPVAGSPTSAPGEDAYFQPAGRIRAFADVTLDGYRPEPTLLVRARARRKSFSWILGAALVPVVVLAVIAFLGRPKTASVPTSTTTLATATLFTTAAPRAAAAATTVPKPTDVIPAKPATESQDGVPVFDVNSLPTAGSRGKPRSAR